jgi:hypothetical protein
MTLEKRGHGISNYLTILDDLNVLELILPAPTNTTIYMIRQNRMIKQLLNLLSPAKTGNSPRQFAARTLEIYNLHP